MSGWIHLNIASSFSRQYGTHQPEDLVSQVANFGQDFAGLTDRDGLFGAVRWVQACERTGVTPVLGVDLAYGIPAPHQTVRRTPAYGGRWLTEDAPRALLYARGAQGWASLCRVVSAAHTNEQVLTFSMLQQHHAGLIAVLGWQSDVGRLVAGRHHEAATQAIRPWQEIFGTSLAIALTCHYTANRHPASLVSAAGLWCWAADRGLPVVLTNAVRMRDPQDARTADVLDAARLLVPLDSSRMVPNSEEAHLLDSATLAHRAEALARAAGRRDTPTLLARTRQLAEACAIDGARDLGLGRVFVPERQVVLGADNTQSLDTLVRTRCESALEQRYRGHVRRLAHERLTAELVTIGELGFAGYFLTVAEVVDLIRSRGVRVAARGSGAGSLVNHLLGISGIDPLAHGLLMERFLSTLRTSLPDIDIDVESARRLEIYDWIFERFGAQRVACVSMMTTYRARHAIRDVGMALGMPAPEIDAFAKAFPHIRARGVRAALTELPELRSSSFGRLAAQGRFDTFLDLVEALDGLPRHISLHPCGVLLSDASLLNRTPVQPSAAGFPMSQFDKDDVETLGLLKLDVLGVRMQSALAHAVQEIHRIHATDIDIDALPLDDPKTFELIASTRTLGCFQIESPGQRELVGKFEPQIFNDLIIDISLFRPGPIKSDMITPFLQARQGWSTPEYLHPDLEPILAETYGVVVFHEQVLRIVAAMTRCTLAQADEVRRTMGSVDGQAQIHDWFVPTARERGYAQSVVEEAWEVLRAFASFGFCKAHAAAFALPTYQSAWIKAHFPAAFYAGILTHDPGMYPKRLIVDDARHHGVQILPLDINASRAAFVVESSEAGAGVRIPFAQVTGISEQEVTDLVRGQPYRSVADAWQRAGMSRPIAERLVLTGAFDGVTDRGVTRRDLLVQLADLDRTRAPAVPGGTQMALAIDEPVRVGGFADMSPAEKVRAELDVLGMDVSHHVLDFSAPMLDALGITRARDLLRCRSGQEILVAGVKVAIQTPPIRSGRRVIFCTLDDSTGAVDLAFFDDVQSSYASTVFGSWLLIARGQIRRTGPRGVSIRATGCWELGHIRDHWDSGGAQAVWSMINADQPVREEPQPRRVYVHASGFRQSPYADVRPAGAVPGRLWHVSPGSTGW